MSYFKLQSYMFTGNMSQKEISYNVPYLKLLRHVILQISILHVHRNMSQKEIPYDVPFLRILGHVILKKYQRRVSATTPLPSPVKCKTASRNLQSKGQYAERKLGQPLTEDFYLLQITAPGKAGSEVCELSSITWRYHYNLNFVYSLRCFNFQEASLLAFIPYQVLQDNIPFSAHVTGLPFLSRGFLLSIPFSGYPIISPPVIVSSSLRPYLYI